MQACSTQRSAYQPEVYLPAQGVKTAGEECDVLQCPGELVHRGPESPGAWSIPRRAHKGRKYHVAAPDLLADLDVSIKCVSHLRTLDLRHTAIDADFAAVHEAGVVGGEK
jgi:hypothetical protein